MKNFLKLLYGLIMFTFPFKILASEPDRLVYKLIAEESKILSKKFEIIPIGTDVSMPNNVIKMLGASFQSKKNFSKNEGKEFVITGAKQFLNAANANESLRKYLIVYPLTINNIEVTLYLNNNQPFDTDNNQISVISIKNGIVSFKYENKIPTKGYSKVEKESYEDNL